MKVVLATLAQFHAAGYSWRKSLQVLPPCVKNKFGGKFKLTKYYLQDDSLLDLHPYLARPYFIPQRRGLHVILFYFSQNFLGENHVLIPQILGE